jgi:hypothetical protein
LILAGVVIRASRRGRDQTKPRKDLTPHARTRTAWLLFGLLTAVSACCCSGRAHGGERRVLCQRPLHGAYLAGVFRNRST